MASLPDTPGGLESALAQAFPPAAWRDLTVLLATSGGPDSVAMTRAVAAAQQPGAGRILLAHFNHRLRGPESDGDERFVVELGDSLGFETIVGRATVEANATASLQEERCRNERYRFFEQAARQAGARYLLTAHTADDQVETVLHRILRGTGLAGLAGIPSQRRLSEATTVVRPLLSIGRGQVLEYLAALGQPYRVDATNELAVATRNRLRGELLPALERDYNPQAKEAIRQLAQQAGEAREVIEALVEPLVDTQVSFVSTAECVVHCEDLTTTHPYLAREILIAAWRRQGWPEQSMGADQWRQLAAMLAPGGERKRVFPGGIVVERVGPTLRLCRSAR